MTPEPSLINHEVFASLGLPKLKIHHGLNHFDFTKGGRLILVIGPMGSGKTEFSARVWRDSKIALKKSLVVGERTSDQGADRRKVMFVRSSLDAGRFKDYPDDALAFRGGYERLGSQLVKIGSSFDLEQALIDRPDCGTWIIDEASFYDERLAYIVERESKKRDLIFIFPTLILNFRRDIFNASAKLLLEVASDILPLTAYCEHSDCLQDSLYTYRYYSVDGLECPAPFFDPLIIIGGDSFKTNPREPNYETRCDHHHYLPGKEYTYLVLKPLAQEASRGNLSPLMGELKLLNHDVNASAFAHELQQKYKPGQTHFNTLKLPCLAEKALLYLFAEQNLLGLEATKEVIKTLALDLEYINQRLGDAGRGLIFY